MLKIFPVETNEDVEQTRTLFREYADFLKKELCEYADLPWLVQYYQDFEEEITNLPDRYRQPEGSILLAMYGEQSAGCVAIGELSDGICEMRRLFVRGQYRRLGIGKMLSETVIKRACEIGYTRMRLTTALEAPKDLYKSLGFKRIAPYRDVHDQIKGIVFMGLKLV